ncbi:hypothetical protein BX666DRAFT_1873837 [Dichotomocladium elegans]|nr:hypothetical protein BX666DRAFT_1873837 [Dichotomocladium elegans]
MSAPKSGLPSSDGFVISGGLGYFDGSALTYQTLMYNATNGTWNPIPTNFLQTAWNALATDYKNGNIAFMYGGRSAIEVGYRNSSETETYPPQGKILSYQNSIFNWAVGPETLLASGIMSGRIRHSAVQGSDGKFYIIGGEYSHTDRPRIKYPQEGF